MSRMASQLNGLFVMNLHISFSQRLIHITFGVKELVYLPKNVTCFLFKLDFLLKTNKQAKPRLKKVRQK